MRFPIPCSYQSAACGTRHCITTFPISWSSSLLWPLTFCFSSGNRWTSPSDRLSPWYKRKQCTFFSYKIKHFRCDGNCAEKWKGSSTIISELLLLELKIKNLKYMYSKLISGRNLHILVLSSYLRRPSGSFLSYFTTKSFFLFPCYMSPWFYDPNILWLWGQKCVSIKDSILILHEERFYCLWRSLLRIIFSIYFFPLKLSQGEKSIFKNVRWKPIQKINLLWSV
jgi:hypothetical protein